MNINIYSIILLVLSAVVGLGGGLVATKIYDNDDKITKFKIITKSLALFGIVLALIISMYL